jgi:phosphoribosylformimino-5-aminoimidazole carboxamide ribotide isomerase
VKTINYTDISKDGMLAGPNIDSVVELLGATRVDVVIAGGVSSINDIRRLKTLPGRGLKGVIIGKALYEGRVDLMEAIEACKE